MGVGSGSKTYEIGYRNTGAKKRTLERANDLQKTEGKQDQ